MSGGRAHQWRQRTEERQWTDCDVSGCHRFVHALSRYCNRHHHHATRYGSATAPVILRRDVRPYEIVARRLLRVNRKHPAIKLACDQLADMLATAARTDHGRPAPKRMDVEGKLRRELARLHTAGITGRRILSLCAGCTSTLAIIPVWSAAIGWALGDTASPLLATSYSTLGANVTAHRKRYRHSQPASWIAAANVSSASLTRCSLR